MAQKQFCDFDPSGHGSEIQRCLAIRCVSEEHIRTAPDEKLGCSLAVERGRNHQRSSALWITRVRVRAAAQQGIRDGGLISYCGPVQRMSLPATMKRTPRQAGALV